MEIRKLLYKTKQLEQARQNALIAITTLEERERRYRNDVNFYIRSTKKSDPVLKELITEEDTISKIEFVKWVVAELNIIIDAISRAAATLNQEQRELIQLRYFEDNSVAYVCERLCMRQNKYNYTHRIALRSMEACLNPLCITEEQLDMLLFAPYGARQQSLGRIKDFGLKIGSF